MGFAPFHGDNGGGDMRCAMNRPYLNIFVLLGLVALASQSHSDELQDNVDPKIQSLVIDYFENRSDLVADEKAFSYCDFLGMDVKKDATEVYAWCVHSFYRLRDNQVLGGAGSSVPTVIQITKTKDGPKVQGFEEAGEGEDNYNQSIDRMFPKQLPEHLHRQEKLDLEKGKAESRVVAYYGSLLKEDRFISKPRPSNLTDPHRHREPIYSYLNLRDSYRQVSFELMKCTSKIVTTGGDNPVTSPDGHFVAWIGVDQGFHLYFSDKTKRLIYEVINRTKDGITNDARMTQIAWKRDHILVVDQINGVNEFHLPSDRDSADAFRGVHFEIDPHFKLILWAVPFGELGFPKVKNK